MPFVSKETFKVGDTWLTDSASTNPLNQNDEIFGASPTPYSLSALKAHSVNGDAGTGKPANGAAANDAAFTGGAFVLLNDGSKASWNGTAWIGI
jgi:hypothetical protein